MMSKHWKFTMAACFALGILPTYAFINPEFTPTHLVKQAESIVAVQLTAPANEDRVKATAGKAFKGKAPAKELVFDLAKLDSSKRKEFERAFDKVGAAGGLVFQGDFADAADDDSQNAAPAFLHFGSTWFSLAQTGDASYEVQDVDENMLGVWNGDTGMLERCVSYVLTDPSADVPAQAGASWDAPQTIGEVKGVVHGANAVDWKQDGQPGVWILADSGDVWIPAGDENPSARAMGSRSVIGTSGAFLAGGKTALVSWDGKAFHLITAKTGDAFDVKPLGLEFDGAVIGLHPVSSKGGAGLVVAGPSRVVLVEDLEGTLRSTPLVSDEAAGELGEAVASVVADLTNDGHADILWMFADGSLLLKGKADGSYEEPILLSNAGAGKGPLKAATGDWDGDGFLDVVTGGTDGARFLINTGAGDFRQHLERSGETSYVVKPQIGSLTVADVNNDGRQDPLFLYPTQGALLFFNRGFASFGFAIDMDPKDAMEESAEGLQAGVAIDFGGRGVHDLVLVTRAGAVVLLPRNVEDQPGMGISVTVSPEVGGPVTVGTTLEHRRLGSWSVFPGGPPALFGVREPGPVTIEWTRPDGTRGQEQIIVEDGNVPFRIK